MGIEAGAADACAAGARVTGPALSPEAALGWLGSLSIDLEATAVVDFGAVAGATDEARASGDAAVPGDSRAAGAGDAAGGTAVLAGDPALGRRAADAFAAAPGATEVDHGDLLAVRTGRRAVAASVGRHVLRGLVRADLAAAAAALEGT
jgi:hypothetical protein